MGMAEAGAALKPAVISVTDASSCANFFFMFSLVSYVYGFGLLGKITCKSCCLFIAQEGQKTYRHCIFSYNTVGCDFYL